MELLYLENQNFRVGSTEHYWWLMYAVLGALFWIQWGRRATTEAAKRKIGLYMSLVGVVVWLYASCVMLLIGKAPLQSLLPFHLCYFLNLLFPVLIWKGPLRYFDWIYSIVMAGCLQALFTPDLDQTAPHYYNLRYWFVHAGLIHSMLYVLVVLGFRPTFLGIFKCILAINLYGLLILPINYLVNTNFLYMKEPAKGSLMDALGPWPYYLLHIEWLMVVFFTVVYLPFAVAPAIRRLKER
jgi:hypothetical integral membrane protein (TIGR02206 family)